MLREVAELTGLSAEVAAVLADTYRGHGSTSRVRCSRIWPRGRRRSGLHRRRRAQRCGDRERVFGAAASSTTIWRLVVRPLPGIPGCPRARSGPREGRGCAPRAGQWLHLECHHHYRPSDNKQDATEILNTTDGWSPAIESRGGIRDGAWVAEATGLRVTAFITDTGHCLVCGQLGGLSSDFDSVLVGPPPSSGKLGAQSFNLDTQPLRGGVA
jgi:hypothetical protein